MENIKYDLVVTKHPGLIEYLKKEKIVEENVSYLYYVDNPDQVRGLNVIGSLTCVMAKYCAAYTEVDLDIPYELRDAYLTESLVRTMLRGLETFYVLPLEEMKKRDAVIRALKFFALESDHEWDSLKEFLLDGNNPKDHDLYKVCQVLDGFHSFTEYVRRYAKPDFWPEIEAELEERVLKDLS